MGTGFDIGKKLAPTNQSSEGFLDVRGGDLLRERFADGGFQVVGEIKEVAPEGVTVFFNDSDRSKFLPHEELLKRFGEKAQKWDVVRPEKLAGITQFKPVKTFRDQYLGAEKDPGGRDPRGRAIHQLEGHLRFVEAEYEKEWRSYNAWGKAASNHLSFSKMIGGWMEYVKGNLASIADIRTLPVVDKGENKERQAKLKKLEDEIDATRIALKELKEDAPGKAVNDPAHTASVHYIMATAFSQTPEQKLAIALETVLRFRQEGDLHAATRVAAAGLWSYRLFSIPGLGSLERKDDGTPSLTSEINQRIELGLIQAAQPVLSSTELGDLRDAILQRNREAGQQNERGRHIFNFQPWLLISGEELALEIARLKLLEMALPEAKKLALRMRKELENSERELGREKAWSIVKKFGKAVLEAVDDPVTVAMVTAGSAAGAVGRRLALRLSTTGLDVVERGALRLAVEGIVFHNFSSVRIKMIDPSHPVDWDIGANVHSILTLGWLKTVLNNYQAVSQKLLSQVAEDCPNLFATLYYSGAFSAEVVALIAQGTSEKIVLKGQKIDAGALSEELTRAVQMVVAFGAYRRAFALNDNDRSSHPTTGVQPEAGFGNRRTPKPSPASQSLSQAKGPNGNRGDLVDDFPPWKTLPPEILDQETISKQIMSAIDEARRTEPKLIGTKTFHLAVWEILRRRNYQYYATRRFGEESTPDPKLNIAFFESVKRRIRNSDKRLNHDGYWIHFGNGPVHEREVEGRFYLAVERGHEAEVLQYLLEELSPDVSFKGKMSGRVREFGDRADSVVLYWKSEDSRPLLLKLIQMAEHHPEWLIDKTPVQTAEIVHPNGKRVPGIAYASEEKGHSFGGFVARILTTLQLTIHEYTVLGRTPSYDEIRTIYEDLCDRYGLDKKAPHTYIKPEGESSSKSIGDLLRAQPLFPPEDPRSSPITLKVVPVPSPIREKLEQLAPPNSELGQFIDRGIVAQDLGGREQVLWDMERFVFLLRERFNNWASIVLGDPDLHSREGAFGSNPSYLTATRHLIELIEFVEANGHPVILEKDRSSFKVLKQTLEETR